MAPARRSAAAEQEEPQEVQEEELVKLQFKEPITWRPGKAIPIDQLLKRLDRLSKELGEMDQELTDIDSLNKIAKDVASHQLLSHKDKGVRAYTACCIVDILRLCAPDAPFTPSQLKDIFNLTVNGIMPALFDPSNPYNNQHKYVLRSFAEIKSIVLLLDVEGAETLLLNLFSTIFDGVSKAKSASGEQVAKDVEFSMLELLGVLVDDAASLPAQVIDVIMAQFLRAAAPGVGNRHDHLPLDDNQATLLLKEEPEAYQMAKNLCLSFPEKMARFVSQYFSDVIVDATSFIARPNGHRDDDDEDNDGPSGPSESDLKELKKAHTLIREVWKAAPMILQNVVPQVDAELSADNVHLRQLATETLGDMISGIGAAGPPPPPTLDPTAYPPLRLEDDDRTEVPIVNILTTPLCAISFSQTHSATFQSFLSRKNDKAAAIRAAWTSAAGYILSTSAGGIGLSREDETDLVQGLGEKLSDNDEKVRLAAVKAIESFKFQDVIMKLAPNGGIGKEGSVLSTLADRCRDRKPAVRVAAMSILGRLWAVATGELLAGNEVVTAALGGVPTRILNVFYANDLELNVLLDRVIYEFLVPLAYPPQKKGPKNASSNGNGSSQSASAPAFDPDAIRAERILLLVRSLDQQAKKAFFAMQARQPQFANVLNTYLKQCDQYNGGVMDDQAERKTANLHKSVLYIAKFLPDDGKSKVDLLRFAKVNDRRNYNLIKYVIGPEHDFKTVHKALKELIKRIQASKDPGILDTLLPILYRSGCIMFNRSHLSTIMEYSKSDKDGMGAVAHEILNEISQRNPELFKSHIGQLCKDLVDQAPTATGENDPIVVETLKACSTYARKYPKDVPMSREFIQTMISYALYGQPTRAAKYAVNIMMAKKDDDTSMVNATDLLQRTMKGWTYGGKHFLNKLAAVSQLELLAPKVTQDAEDRILNMTVQQILLQVRREASDRDPDWVDDSDMDEECQAKCLALKTLANRLRSMKDIKDAKEKAKPVWKLFKTLITKDGELCKTADTPKHHRSRLRLLAAQLLLKLCTQKHFDDLLSPEDFNKLAFTTQDAVQEVRHGFIRKLQKYLADSKLRSRYYTIAFLTAFEPNSEFKMRVETWIRSRARHFQDQNQPVLEATLARLLSILAHHPDYSAVLDELTDHARYLIYYVSLVATESNLGLIYKYAERVKQTQDALDPQSDAHQVLSDLAQAVIRKWQEKRNWVFSAYPEKVGLPLGLYTALQSHSEAQGIAEKNFLPEGIDEKLDDVLRALDRKKKRKSVDDGRAAHHPPSKKTRVQAATREPKQPKAARPSNLAHSKKSSGATPKVKKAPPSKPKKTRQSSPDVTDANRRRSGRSRKSNTYIERDSSEDDEEMLDGVAEWEYVSKSGSGDEDEKEDGGKDEHAPPDDSDKEAVPTEEEDEETEEKEEEAPAPTRRGGRAAPKPAMKAKALPARSKRNGKAAAAREEEEESELSEPKSDVEDEADPPAAEKVKEDDDEGDLSTPPVSSPPPAPSPAKAAANGRNARITATTAGGGGTKRQPKAVAKGKAAVGRATRGRGKKALSAETVKADDMDEDED
ncbi:putative SPO76 protein [Apodospora peruviana]|uniref:SPO76 protein n=1 Tax=Apodospora peruviana TaxID=516989 RepID=A0AAE0IC18_9PEZI|nr:putative SPO76 protein [Apodospora peruviana]